MQAPEAVSAGQWDVNAPLCVSVRRLASFCIEKESLGSTMEGKPSVTNLQNTSCSTSLGQQFSSSCNSEEQVFVDAGVPRWEGDQRSCPPAIKDNLSLVVKPSLSSVEMPHLNGRNGSRHEPQVTQLPYGDPGENYSDDSHSDNGIPLTATNGCQISQSKVHNIEAICPVEEGSTYSDAADTFVQTEAYWSTCGVRICSAAEDQDQLVSHTDPNARDFIMRRFLPAAQAMAMESSQPSDHRHLHYAEPSRKVSILSIPLSTRFANEVQEGVNSGAKATGDTSMKACGIPLRLGGTFRRLKSRFQTTRSRRKSQSNRKITDEDSEEFWSGEENFENEENKNYQNGGSGRLMKNLEGLAKPNSGSQKNSIHVGETRQGGVADGFVQMRPGGFRKHSSQTFSMPEGKGFLGMPKISELKDSSKGEVEVKQLDRLGARLTHLLSKSNYVEPRNPRAGDIDEADAHMSRDSQLPATGSVEVMPDEPSGPVVVESSNEDTMSAGSFPKGWPLARGYSGLPHASSITSTSPVESPTSALAQGRVSVEKDSSFSGLPPPLPKSPSESWLLHAVPSTQSVKLRTISSAKPLESLPSKEQDPTWEARALQSLEVRVAPEKEPLLRKVTTSGKMWTPGEMRSGTEKCVMDVSTTYGPQCSK